MRFIVGLALLFGGACGTALHEPAFRTDPTVPPAPPGPTAPLGPSTEAAADSAFVTALRAQLQAATQANTFSGAVLVTRDGKTVFEGAYNLADREQNVSNQSPPGPHALRSPPAACSLNRRVVGSIPTAPIADARLVHRDLQFLPRRLYLVIRSDL